MGKTGPLHRDTQGSTVRTVTVSTLFFRTITVRWPHYVTKKLCIVHCVTYNNKKAQLSLTNPRDAKACQKLLQFDVLTTLSLTIVAYLHSFSCCCTRDLRNLAKFIENSNLWSSRSSEVIDLGVNRKLIVTLAVSVTVFQILTLKAGRSLNFHTLPFFEAP